MPPTSPMNTSVLCSVSPRIARPPQSSRNAGCQAASCADSVAAGHKAKNTLAVSDG
jgi:hypothetical protein